MLGVLSDNVSVCACVCIRAGLPGPARVLNITAAEENEDGGGNLEKAREKKLPALRSLTLPTLTGTLFCLRVVVFAFSRAMLCMLSDTRSVSVPVCVRACVCVCVLGRGRQVWRGR